MNEREHFFALQEAYHELIQRNEGRLDDFLSGLKPKEATPESKSQEFKPFKRRQEPWSRVAARMEAKHKEEYWKQKTESLESDVADLEKKIDERNRRANTGSASS